MTTSIRIQASGGGDFSAYVAEPVGEPRAAILVAQEIFGVNTGLRRKCDLLAQQGYLAVAPDLFWRMQPEVQLDPNIESSHKPAIDYVMRFDEDAATRDVASTIDTLRTMVSAGCKVGLMGYCLGGRLAFLAATRTDVDASIGYYDVNIDLLLGEKDRIRRPLLLHIAGIDPYVDEAKQAVIHAALDTHPQVTIYDYPGEHHGFARELGANRSAQAAAEADARTAAFMERHLG